MKSTTSLYYVEVKEDGVPKMVPHTKNTKHCEFMDRGKAVKFKKDLIKAYPGTWFRLCKSTTIETNGLWEKTVSDK